MKKVCILGSTGSIGTQTLDIIRMSGGYRISVLAARSNIELLEKQVREFTPEKVCVYEEKSAEELKKRISDISVRVYTGMEGLIECAADTAADIVVVALVGMIGIQPTIAAIEAGKDIALANKETLVTAGHIIIPLVKKHGVRLLPIDSEHSAIFQSLQGRSGLYSGAYKYENEADMAGIEKIILTASGGPFRGYSAEQLKSVKAADALKHPNWMMGRKITIDSATMVNKGLEVMEAKWLFGVDTDHIEVVIQPKSIIHSAVQFCDGSIIAQLGMPDMRIPIQYALYYPERKPYKSERLDLFKLGNIAFEKPDYNVFKGLRLALDVCRRGGSLPTVYNAANEYAVARFLEEKISFTDIADMIEAAVENHKFISGPDINEVLSIEKETYYYAEEYFRRIRKDK